MGLEQELEEMLEVERFEPPAEFRERALLERPGDLRGGGGRPRGLVAARRRRSCSTGTTEPSQGLDDSNPPFYKWFADGG